MYYTRNLHRGRRGVTC